VFECFGYLRIEANAVTARDRFVRFRVPVRGFFFQNGKWTAARSVGGALSYGDER